MYSEASIFTGLLFFISMGLSLLSMYFGFRALRISYYTFQKGETPSGSAMWHNLKGKKTSQFARTQLIAGLVILAWSGFFLYLTFIWGASILNTVLVSL